MKHPIFIAALLVISLLGFALGRATGVKDSAYGETGAVQPVSAQIAPAASPVPGESKNIVLETPAEGSKTAGSLVVAGRAKAGDASHTLNIFVTDETGAVIGSAVSAAAARAGEFGRFSETIKLPAAASGRAKVEVFWRAPDSSRRDQVTRRIIIIDPTQLAIKIFFQKNGWYDGGCDSVQPVERQISSSSSVYLETLKELIKGPTLEERDAGFTSAISPDALIKTAAADAHGVVTVDFARAYIGSTASECAKRVASSQVVSTLKQFPEVRDVIIIVNGLSE